MKRTRVERIRFPYLLVLLPTFAVLCLCVALSAVYLQRLPERELRRRVENLACTIDRGLLRELGRLEAVAFLEETSRILKWGRSNRASLLQNVREMESRWRGLGKSDREVRMILENSCSEALRRLCSSDPFLEQLMVIDDAGVVLAAAYRPDRPYVADEPWFEKVKAGPRLRLVAADLRNKNRRSLLVPLRASDGTFRGVVRGDVLIARLCQPDDLSGLEALGRGWALGLVGTAPVVLAGSESDYNLFVTRYMDRFGLAVERCTLRFYGRLAVVVPLSLALADHGEVGLSLVARNRLGLAAYAVPGAVLLVGLLFLGALKKLTDWWIRSSFLEPYAEVLEAGRWIIDRALHKPVEFGEAISAGLRRRGATSAIRHTLEEWLGSLKQAAEDEIAAHTAEMQRDLELAREFQQAYLERPYPQVPIVHIEGRLRLQFHHLYHPALALGGDFFDIMALGPDAAGIFIADVMGHGARSALITAMLRTLIGDLSSQGRNARHFLTELNRQFSNMLTAIPSPLFASAFYFVADTTARVGTYSSAGHPAPFHVRRSVGRITRLEVPEPHGAALGLIPDEKYTGGHVRLIDGDLFLFFTDGVYEARNSSGEEYGIGRLESVLRSVLYRDGGQILQEVYQSILRFVGDEPVADDICMVAVEITTSAVKEDTGRRS